MNDYVKILKEVCSEEELLLAMYCTPLKKGYIRLSAMFDLMNGMKKEIVMKKSKISIRTLQFWIQRFTERGIDALITKPRPGRPKILTKKQNKMIIDILENPHKVKETHWTAIKLHGYIKNKYKIQISYSTLVRTLHEEDYHLKVPRKMPANGDEKLKKAFKIELESMMKDSKNEIWFGDETGIEADPTPRKRWVKKGEKTTIPYHGKHIRANVIGAICPDSGEVSALVFDYCDVQTFQAFLNQLAEQTKARAESKNIILILDNASWHKSARLNWHHIQPVYLPPYSPDLNPIERLWLILKKNFFSDFIAHTPRELINRICRAIRFYIDRPSLVMKTCKILGRLLKNAI